MIQQIKLLYSIANFMVERDMSLKACIIISVPVGPQMSHWIFRVTSDTGSETQDTKGDIGHPRVRAYYGLIYNFSFYFEHNNIINHII